MTNTIKDGTGTGNRVKVDIDNRIHALAVSKSSEQQGAIDGNTYNINTGTITLTDASESGLLYLKNTSEAKRIVISTVGYLIGNSTAGAGDLELTIVKGVTGGTLVDAASAVAINSNKNLSVSTQLSATAYKGAQGVTLTGGSDMYKSLLASAATRYVIATGDLILGPNDVIGIKITPQTSNTSMGIQVFLSIIEEDHE